jgi:hypothetical protein
MVLRTNFLEVVPAVLGVQGPPPPEFPGLLPPPQAIISERVENESKLIMVLRFIWVPLRPVCFGVITFRLPLRQGQTDPAYA